MTSTLAKVAAKASVAGGVLYWSIQQGIWGTSEEGAQAGKKLGKAIAEPTKYFVKKFLSATDIRSTVKKEWNFRVSSMLTKSSYTPSIGEICKQRARSAVRDYNQTNTSNLKSKKEINHLVSNETKQKSPAQVITGPQFSVSKDLPTPRVSSNKENINKSADRKLVTEFTNKRSPSPNEKDDGILNFKSLTKRFPSIESIYYRLSEKVLPLKSDETKLTEEKARTESFARSEQTQKNKSPEKKQFQGRDRVKSSPPKMKVVNNEQESSKFNNLVKPNSYKMHKTPLDTLSIEAASCCADRDPSPVKVNKTSFKSNNGTPAHSPSRIDRTVNQSQLSEQNHISLGSPPESFLITTANSNKSVDRLSSPKNYPFSGKEMFEPTVDDLTRFDSEQENQLSDLIFPHFQIATEIKSSVLKTSENPLAETLLKSDNKNFSSNIDVQQDNSFSPVSMSKPTLKNKPDFNVHPTSSSSIKKTLEPKASTSNISSNPKRTGGLTSPTLLTRKRLKKLPNSELPSSTSTNQQQKAKEMVILKDSLQILTEAAEQALNSAFLKSSLIFSDDINEPETDSSIFPSGATSTAPFLPEFGTNFYKPKDDYSSRIPTMVSPTKAIFSTKNLAEAMRVISNITTKTSKSPKSTNIPKDVLPKFSSASVVLSEETSPFHNIDLIKLDLSDPSSSFLNQPISIETAFTQPCQSRSTIRHLFSNEALSYQLNQNKTSINQQSPNKRATHKLTHNKSSFNLLNPNKTTLSNVSSSKIPFNQLFPNNTAIFQLSPSKTKLNEPSLRTSALDRAKNYQITVTKKRQRATYLNQQSPLKRTVFPVSSISKSFIGHISPSKFKSTFEHLDKTKLRAQSSSPIRNSFLQTLNPLKSALFINDVAYIKPATHLTGGIVSQIDPQKSSNFHNYVDFNSSANAPKTAQFMNGGLTSMIGQQPSTTDLCNMSPKASSTFCIKAKLDTKVNPKDIAAIISHNACRDSSADSFLAKMYYNNNDVLASMNIEIDSTGDSNKHNSPTGRNGLTSTLVPSAPTFIISPYEKACTNN